MKEKIFKYIALAFIILIGLNLIGAFGINIWGMFDSYKRSQKNEIQGQTREELEKEYPLEEIYFPRIDSLILNHPKQALIFIEKVENEYPGNDQVLLKKGIAYSYLDSIDLALKTFKASMELRGFRYPKILGHIAWAHKEKGEIDSAFAYLEEAADMNEDFILQIAHLYKSTGDSVNAIQAYSQVIKNWEDSNLALQRWKNIQYLKKTIDSLKH